MNRQVLEELANALVDAETLAGPALEVFLEAVQAWPQPLVPGLNGNSPVTLRAQVGGGEAETPPYGTETLDLPPSVVAAARACPSRTARDRQPPAVAYA